MFTVFEKFFNIVWALMMREINTIYGDAKLGYLWVFLNSIYKIAFFWVIREYLGWHAPHGMSLPAFLITGVVIWDIFSTTVNKVMLAIDSNKTLLNFPQILPFSLFVSRTLVIWLTQLLVFSILMFTAHIMGYEIYIANGIPIMGSFILSGLLGMGIGMLCCIGSLYIPTIKRIVPFIFQILFWVSGVFFPIRSLHFLIGDNLYYNPVLHLIEMLRSGFSATYYVMDYSYMYVISVFVIISTVALLFEKNARRRIIVT